MIEPVKVKNNEKGSVLEIIDDHPYEIYATVNLQQREMTVVNKRLHWTIRNTAITGTLDDMTYMKFNAGDCMTGKIIIVETTEPPYPDTPEKCLKWDEGSVCRTADGKVIYQQTFYTDDPNAEDVIL